ncbi:fungal-specific transcription factor domain-containing protein [Triangularia verruculosa]|uniref:Fungal-specific transcription factor domain-containing protein n=1 Tax=Triangularia verruculosa TaxID=2587418 RepID=A0AAN6XDW1_9PEZI|nr:fungal-specific transcription factor domain-containing protein [Triangularia verruculosa]
MSRSFPVVSSDGNFRWSDSHSQSMDSDEIPHVGLPSPWLDSLSTGSNSLSTSSSTLSFAHTGQLSPQLSPVSTGMAMSCGGSSCLASPSLSPPTTAMNAHSLSSSASTESSWTLGYSGSGSDEGHEHEQLPRGAMGHHHDMHHDQMPWEQDDSDDLLTAKLEPLDDDGFCMDDLGEAPATPIGGVAHALGLDQPKPKRPRGRPRKHPLTPNLTANKVTKGRTKTGCLTCRKRKKKCDEAKPRCMNCEKNAVVCEGYPEKQIWKSGKERAEEERLKSHSVVSITMQPIFHGLETPADMIFWKHYNEHLSAVLTVEGEHKNAFKDMMVPIAVKHQGLMHSILSLASKHIDFDTPYGANILRNNPSTTLDAIRERSDWHHDQARQKFFEDVEFSKGKPCTDDEVLVSARYGQMLCFLLEALAEGNPRGEHRVHLSAYRSLIASSPPGDSAFLSFIAEFFQYHIFADELIHSSDKSSYGSMSNAQELPPIPDIHPPRLLGVADGLLEHIIPINSIRNSIRRNMAAHEPVIVDYMSLYRAADIDSAIREWAPHLPPGDNRGNVSLLYKHMMQIYLIRTILPPVTSSPTPTAASVSSFSQRLHSSPSTSGRPASSVVNTPPQSASTSCASSPKLGPSHPSMSDPNAYPAKRTSNVIAPFSTVSPIRKNSSGNAPITAEKRPESPPPIRQPASHDVRITRAVEESLDILDTFKPSDPSQTLLLLPCFVIGTVCFKPRQQERLRAAIKCARGYTGLRNADRVVEVLEELWRLMEMGEWAQVWDWSRVAKDMGLDFIPA